MQRGWMAYSPTTGSSFGWTSGTAGGGVAADDARPELADAGRLVRRAVRGLVRTARSGEEPTLHALLQVHFPDRIDTLAVVEESWAPYEHVNVQAGLDAWLAEPGRRHELVGVTGFQHHPFGLGELLTGSTAGEPFGPRPGNVARANLSCGAGGAVRPCVRCGLYLVQDDGERRTAVLLRGPERHSMQENVTVQIASTDPEHAAAASAGIRALAIEHNVFRGQLLSFGGEVFGHGETILHFHERPSVTADQLVLPAATIDAVTRQVVGLARHKDRLLAAGQHLKRGLLLYGPPGVGKTHTVRYLLSQLRHVTVVQLTGTALHLIAEACSVARTLQPAVVVVEDVDLIAEERGLHPGNHPLLFQLLNEMDGLAADADVAFVLTTNRPDLLEPALAARPGRVDQAVELALPDVAGRRALLDLYRGGLSVDTTRLDDVLARTDGVTASFLKELIRRAAVLAADADPHGEHLHVSADVLDAALDELLDTRNAMTRRVLGAGAATVRDAPAEWER